MIVTVVATQLKVYIQEQTIYPEIDDGYVAMAVNRNTFHQLLDARSMNINAAVVFILCPIITFIILVCILIIILILHCFRGTFEERELNRHRKAAIVSSAIVGINRLIYFLILDSFAVSFRSTITNNDYATIHFEDQVNFHSINIPFVIDILLLVSSIICAGTSIAIFCICPHDQNKTNAQTKKESDQLNADNEHPAVESEAVELQHLASAPIHHLEASGNNKVTADKMTQTGEPEKIKFANKMTQTGEPENIITQTGEPKNIITQTGKCIRIAYYLLMSISISFLLGVLIHMPYIAMAYLSDPRHAASVLLYYIVITFVEFGLLEFTFRSTIFFGKRQSESTIFNCGRCMYVYGICTAILFSVLIHALTVTATIFFYLIPVSESIGTAPSQIVVTYQTAFILVGGYIIYQVIIKKQNSFQRAIREYNDEWESLPDHELLTKFYKDTIEKTDKYIQHVTGDTRDHRTQRKSKQ